MRPLAVTLTLLMLAGTAHAQRTGMAYGKAPAAPAPVPDPTVVGIVAKPGNQVPTDLTFRDEHERPITLAQAAAGKPTILVLAYYRCPMLCNQVLNGLVECLRELPQEYTAGEKFNVVTVSFDPKERPALAWEKKQSYLKHYGRPPAEQGWHFLTGDKPAIDALCESVGFRYQYDKVRKQYNHDSAIMILTADGKVSRYFFGVQYQPLDVRLGLVDASQGTIGTVVDKVARLLCYEYDPHTGKYTFTVMVILRIVFGVLVLVMAVWLARVWRRSRRRAEPAALTA